LTPIRPGTPPAQPASSAGADAARLAAQRAFFQQAMGRPAAAQATAPTTAQAPTPPVRTVELRPAANAEAPAKILRPGSLLDIRV
jgi:hypothetical protein